VVRGDDQEAIFGERLQQLRQPVVEALYVLGHALRVAAVPVFRVKVHEVGEDEAAPYASQSLQDRVYFGRVVRRGGEVVGDALAVEDVPDLAHRDYLVGCVLYPVEVGLRGRGDAVVVAVLVLALVDACAAAERPRYDPLHQDLPLPDEHAVGLLAGFVQLIEWNYAGVGGDLEDGVSRGVDDPGPRLLLLRPQFLDDLRAGCWPVPEDPAPGLVLEAHQHPVGEAVGVGRQGIVEDQSHHLPVPGEGGFGRRELDHEAVGGFSEWWLALSPRWVPRSPARGP
jgi:hypothetical protein